MSWLLHIAIAAAIAISLLPAPAAAGIVLHPSGDSNFHRRVLAALALLARSEDPLLRRLHASVVNSPAIITIRPITGDRATWHPDGDRTRGHTDPADTRPKSRGRRKPTDAIVFVPPDAVEPGSNHWKNGLFVHELVHAIDLAYGRYDPDYTIRERRAVFLQNAWRARQGYRLRTTYHGRFATLDYQEAVRRGTIGEFGRHVFTRAGLPGS